MDAGLDAELGGAGGDGFLHALGELGLGVLVGIRRAARLSEAAERAADDANVGDVDVAVDDERHRLAGELGPELVGGRAHVLDHRRTALGRTARSAPRRSAAAPSRARSIARGAIVSATVTSARRPDPRRGMNDQ